MGNAYWTKRVEQKSVNRMQFAKPLNDLQAVASLWAALFLFLPLTVFGLNLNDVEITRSQILQGALVFALALVPILVLLVWLPRGGHAVKASIQVAATQLP